LCFQNEENLPIYNAARNRPGQAVADRLTAASACSAHSFGGAAATLEQIHEADKRAALAQAAHVETVVAGKPSRASAVATDQ
jgi:hypothetical protein